jgi:hypothetical protein
MTAAPAIPDPDLSRTLPEKLPVAWPCMAGWIISAKTQKTTRARILWDLVPAEASTDLGNLVRTMLRFIVNPFLTNLATVVFA